MNAGAIASIVGEIKGGADMVLTTIGELDPAVEPEAATIDAVVGVLGQIASKALSAWSAASGTPITEASVMALLPDSTPLPAPTV